MHPRSAAEIWASATLRPTRKSHKPATEISDLGGPLHFAWSSSDPFDLVLNGSNRYWGYWNEFCKQENQNLLKAIYSNEEGKERTDRWMLWESKWWDEVQKSKKLSGLDVITPYFTDVSSMRKHVDFTEQRPWIQWKCVCAVQHMRIV